MDRHLTVSGFVVHEGRVALHWHRKNAMWLPAGGHIEPGESPAEAVLREIKEEFDIQASIAALAPHVDYTPGPTQEEPPFTVLICPVGPGHEHIDMVYFCRAERGYPGRSYDADGPVQWFDIAALEVGTASYNGSSIAFPPDVQALGIESIRLLKETASVR